MKHKTPLALGLVLGSLSLCLVGYAEEHGRGGGRPAPPPFQPHAAGPHPHGPTLHPHPVRILGPRAVMHGHTGWNHWAHPEFPRPAYYWNWAGVHNVTCIAEDSYGDQYPVSEPAAPGFGLENMNEVEDDALDRCYNESGNDSTCVLMTCSHV